MRSRLSPAVSGAMLRCRAVVLAVLLTACAGARGVRPALLDVPHCCAAGRALAPDALRAAVLTRAAAAAACVEAAAPRPWAPLVYAPARKAFLERGRLPVHWRMGDSALPACTDLRVLLEHAAPYTLLASNGSLLLRSVARALPPARYCVDAAATLVCLEDDDRPPSKCCTKGCVYDGAACVPDEARAAAALQELRALAESGAALGRGWPSCAAGTQYTVAGALAGARLEGNGSVRLAGGALLAGGEWCAEAVAGEAGARVLACAGAEPASDARSLGHVLYGVGLAVDAAFLAATLAASCALPAADRSLHWRCQMQYMASLMLADAQLAGMQLANYQPPPTLCRALAVCVHFLFLAAFFWLNTMCLNIWWTFRDFRPTKLRRGQERRWLRMYTVYAWGGPLCLAGCTALLDALSPPPDGPALPRPQFAVQRCWFYGDTETLIFFFGPVSVLLLVNLALFVSTMRQLTCGIWRRDEVKSTSEPVALGRVCARLVVVMGVTWGADVVSWAAGSPEYVRYGTGVANALQGVFLFLVVGAPAARRARNERARAQAVHGDLVLSELRDNRPAARRTRPEF